MIFKILARLLLSSVYVRLAVADNAFGATCRDFILFQPAGNPDVNPNMPPYAAELNGNCHKIIGTWRIDTWININHCFANDGGTLHARIK